MKLAAAHAIAGVIPRDQLREDYIVPSVFDLRVAPAVAEATIDAAVRTGVARRVPTEAVADGDEVFSTPSLRTGGA